MQTEGYFELFAVSSLLTGNYGIYKLTIRALWRDLLAEEMPIMALKGGLIRQTDRHHRIAYCLSGIYNAALF
jgi:hypothetical protein